MPSRCVVSRIGRTSTNEPGRNARTEPISTVKPPFTLLEIIPLTISSLSEIFSRKFQVSTRLAFSRDSKVWPIPLSTASTTTSTVSPTSTSSSPSSLKNSSRATIPSDLRPVSTVIQSLSMATTVPVITEPRSISRPVSSMLASNSSANDSIMSTFV